MRKYILIITALFLLTAVLLSGCTQSDPVSRQDKTAGSEVMISTKERDYWPTEDWKTSLPEKQGMNAEILDELDREINENYRHIQSFLVIKGGYLVFEKYYTNQGQHFGSEDVHWLASATKTVTGALIGIAIEQGYIENISQKVVDYFPEDIPENADETLNQMEIRHLLTMTTGFLWSDSTDDSNTDRVNNALNRVMIYEPGEVFNYDSPASNLLSAIITETTGKNALAFADENLFGPLGIKDRIWQSDNRGNSHGDYMLALRPRDMAKIGYLYLNQGIWDGEQVVPAAWIAESTKVQSEGGSPHYENYGYQCWVTNVNGYDAYFAGGFGGQFIFVVPDLDIVVVITSDWDMHHEENRDLISEYVIPAINNATHR